jgi:hypothetical protein
MEKLSKTLLLNLIDSVDFSLVPFSKEDFVTAILLFEFPIESY